MEQLTISPLNASFMDNIQEELSKIGSKLIPNFFSFVVQLLALIVVIIIVMVLLFKPVKKTLNARSDYIETQINQAKENNVISEQNKVQSEQEIIAARKESSKIIANANKLIEAQKADMIMETEEQIKRMKLDAEEEIKKAKQEAIKDVHNEIVNVALDASKELLQREINEKDSSKFVEDFIKEVK